MLHTRSGMVNVPGSLVSASMVCRRSAAVLPSTPRAEFVGGHREPGAHRDPNPSTKGNKRNKETNGKEEVFSPRDGQDRVGYCPLNQEGA